jgi:ABC-type transport system involved in cytochrome bd biosynthesis fused ATPase/permease subunit
LHPSPVATAIIASFTHAQRGVDSVVVYFRGFLPALVSFGLFCLVLSVGLEPLGLTVALILALVVQLSTQTVTLWSMTRAERAQVVGSRQ